MITLNDPIPADFYAELDLILKNQGEINEQFAYLAKTFRKVVNVATKDQRIAFRNFYGRFRYLLSQLQLDDSERQNLDAFRRFVSYGNPRTLDRDTLLQGVALLYKFIKVMQVGQLGHQALQTISCRKDYFRSRFPQPKYGQVKNLRILCESWTDLYPMNGMTCFTIKGYDIENLEGLVEILVKAHPFGDFTKIRELLAQNAILQFNNITALAGSGNLYCTTPASLVTLEPDFLMDASSVGECFSNGGSNSDIFLLSKMVDSLPGIAALKGSIVGYYLDEIVRNNDQNRELIYVAAQRTYALRAAQFGNAEMQGLKQSIFTEHLANIESLVDMQDSKELWIEPTYFSTEFGLQGRLDLLGNDETLGTKDIVELKSGTPSNPNFNVAWHNHKMQVVCYDMLLQSTYGTSRRGANAVFYSKCNISPYRIIVSEQSEKVKILHVRNEIVSKIFKIANTEFDQLIRIKDQGITGLPPFRSADLESFRQSYTPQRIASQYYQELLAFTLRELINTKVGNYLKEDEEEQQNGFAGLWLDNLITKEKDYRIVYDLSVVSIDEEKGEINLQFDANVAHSFRKGDLIVLYPKTSKGYVVLSQHILKGSIFDLHLDRIVVSLFNIQTNYAFIRDYDQWAIEPDIFERNFWSTVSCLFNVLTCSERKKRLLFGHEMPVTNATVNYIKENIRPNQRRVIQNALNAQDYYLLQGPPGTGKTSTFLVNYVEASIKQSTDKVVILAFTNKAVDKICESLKAPRKGTRAINYLRLGSKHVVDDNLFSGQLFDNNPDNWRRVIDSHQVFVTTVATFQNNWLLLKEFIHFRQVVIDEASQLTESSLAGIVALFEKFVLIGDHKQLPSVVTQTEKNCLTQSAFLHRLGITDFRISLFERLFRNARRNGWQDVYGQLTDHYRMHQNIAALISSHYEKPLVSQLPEQATGVAPYLLPAGHPLYPLTQSRIIFLETPPEAVLKKNIKEAKIAAKIAENLIEAGVVKPSEIGIVTPFRAQISEIRKMLKKDLLSDPSFIVDTVERYQGDERKVVIFSTTIASPRQIEGIQSIASNDSDRTDRKLLVCISRASTQFIVLGNQNALGCADSYRQILRQITAKNGILGREFSNKILQL